MEYRRFSFPDFIERIKDKSWFEIIRSAEKEADLAEHSSSRVKGAVNNRQMGSMIYAQELKEFIFFMRQGIKPFTVNELNWNLYRKVVDKLVEKGHFMPSIYDLFTETKKED